MFYTLNIENFFCIEAMVLVFDLLLFCCRFVLAASATARRTRSESFFTFKLPNLKSDSFLFAVAIFVVRSNRKWVVSFLKPAYYLQCMKQHGFFTSTTLVFVTSVPQASRRLADFILISPLQSYVNSFGFLRQLKEAASSHFKLFCAFHFTSRHCKIEFVGYIGILSFLKTKETNFYQTITSVRTKVYVVNFTLKHLKNVYSR